MVAQRLLLYDALLRAEERWHPVRLSIGPDMNANTFMDLALVADGSRLLQELIETTPTGLKLLQRICLEHAVLLVRHHHANFVVTKLIQESPPWFCYRLCLAFAGNVCELARHRCGSRVLERIIEHHGHGQVDFFYAEFIPHAARIVGDKYGNYVIQNVMQNGPQPWRRRCLLLIIKGASRKGRAGRYFCCTLSSVFERSTDQHILRLLAPLRSTFEKAEFHHDSMAADGNSQ